MFGLANDRCYRYCICIKGKTIFNLDGARRLQDFIEKLGMFTSIRAEEIDVFRRTREYAVVLVEKESSFQNDGVSVLGQDDPMEQSLLLIQRQNTLKLNPFLPRHIEKFVSN